MQDKKNEMTVSYCGTRGSFSEIAASKLFPSGELIPCASFREAYDLVTTGKAERALLPIENSYAGEVAATVDLLYRGRLFVSDLYEMKIEQNLIGIKGTTLADVKKVISHPQALAQCAEYIAAHKYAEIVSENTAFAAKTVADTGSKELAAIASRACAKLYGLEVIAADIEESRENTTRFALFSTGATTKREGEHLILLFAVGDRSGALAEALSIIARYGYNMKSLHSRPLKDRPWQYYFYVEAEGNGSEEDLLDELKKCCEDAKIAGRFLPDKQILL